MNPDLRGGKPATNCLNYGTVRVRYGIKCERTVNAKAIPVTGRGGPYGCETSRLPHFLENRLIDGGKIVSLTRWPPFTLCTVPGTRFC
jgi:hypothetical protein